MPHMSGMELAQRIRERREAAELLFFTASREYAVDAFTVRAAGYLLKPVEKAAFQKALLSALCTLSGRESAFLLVKTKDGIRKICLRELMLAESFNHSRVYTLADGTAVETADTLASLMEQLAKEPRFFSPHRTYIVNLDYVSRLASAELLLTNGKRLPVSRKLYPKLKAAYMKYAF